MIVDVVERVSQIRYQLGLSRPEQSTDGTGFASSLAAALGTGDAGGATGNTRLGGGDWLGGGSSGGYSGSATGSAVVADARRYLGIPYVYGSNNPAHGLDCSGLVQRVYKDLGVSLPRTAAQQAKVGQPVASLAQARPGDILAFNSPVDHVAIYVGDGMMIAAPHTGDHVKVQKVYQTPSTIRRIVGSTSATGTGAGTWNALATGPALRPAALGGAGSGTGDGAGSVPYADLFRAAAARNGLPASLLAAVAKVESGYNPNAVSSAGARGLMQIMPSTASGLGVDPLDPTQAIDGAARLLARNLRDFGSVPLALAAYNAGAGAVRRYGGIPPYAETQAYVPKVQAAMAALNAKGFS